MSQETEKSAGKTSHHKILRPASTLTGLLLFAACASIIQPRSEFLLATTGQTQSDAELAADQAEYAKAQAISNAEIENDKLRNNTTALEQPDELQEQLTELNAKATNSGIVVTLSYVLFGTGQYAINEDAFNHLDKLVKFLDRYQDRTVLIEGHTDNTGKQDINLGLSQQRAGSVKSYLVKHGIATNRINTRGKGENYPVASNDLASGREMNRRVEVLIGKPSISASVP